MCICITDSLFCSLETKTTFLSQLHSSKVKKKKKKKKKPYWVSGAAWLGLPAQVTPVGRVTWTSSTAYPSSASSSKSGDENHHRDCYENLKG